ncbi:MAG: PH domain-containing protein [Candidatus Hydrogenedentes bacterium]|nr:PH domain-containing protein [Candidatus Hydrogenedentota bacterium]
MTAKEALMDGRFFPCTLSRRDRRGTLAAIVFIAAVLLALIGLATVVAIASGDRAAKLMLILVISIAAIISGFLYAVARYAPKGCRIDRDGISIVRRNGKSILLPAQEIQSVEPAGRERFHERMRVVGVGGLFGSWGWFWNPDLYDFHGYVTNDSLVLIHTAHQGPFLISPDARDEFIACATKTFNLSPRPATPSE